MFTEDGQRLESVSADGVVNSTGPLPENKANEVQIGQCRTAKFSSNGDWLVCERTDVDDFFADVIQMKTTKSSWTVSQWPFYEGYAPSAIAISDDGRMVAAGRERGGTILYRVPQEASTHRNGKEREEITSLRDRMATTIAFSHGGDLLITAEDDKTVRLTDVKDKQVKERARIQQSATVTSLAIDQQGRIFTGGTSGSVKSWNSDLDSILKRLCNSPGVNLSKDQWKRSGYLDDVAWRPVCENWR
jgi:WD40 repeat protein